MSQTETMLVEGLEHRAHSYRRELISTARELARRATRLADDVEARGDDALVSANGVVQALGPMLDAHCGAYAATVDALKTARALAAREAGESS